MSHRFYVNRPLTPGRVVLQGAEAHHLGAVSRLRPGDLVYLFNGDGQEYRSEIVATGRRTVELQILEAAAPQRELPFRLTVACPLPKGDRGQFLVEKLTELGVASYIPLRTEHSVTHPGEGRTGKLQRYVQEASKQCGRNVLMVIEPLSEWHELLRRGDLPGRRWLGCPNGRDRPGGQGQDALLAVGPEGGFTSAEVETAAAAGWSLLDLGPRVLRVETAALVLVTLACH